MRPRSYLTRDFLILGLSGPVIVLNLWILAQIFRYFEQLITILAIAAILALLLSYVVRLLEKLFCSRLQAVILVCLVFLSLLGVLGLTLIPVVLEQATQLLQVLPAWLDASNQNLRGLSEFIDKRNFPLNLNQITHQLEAQIQILLGLLPGLAIGTLGRLFDTVLVIVLAFYMLLDGDRLWQGLLNLLPPKLGLALSRSLQVNFHRFFLSQLILALFMVVTLAPLLLLLQVKFGLLFALLIGVFELIPLIGAAVGIGLVTLLVMLQGFWLGVQVGAIATVLQQIRDNVITPKFLGKAIGLNPIWIFIALLIGARVAGLLGVLLSIPIAGTIKSTIEAMRTLNQSEILTLLALKPGKPQL